MPNDPRFYETSFVHDGQTVRRTYADLLVYDHTKPGDDEGDKFWCVQALVQDRRIVDHYEYSSHMVRDIIRAIKKMNPALQRKRIWIYKYSAESTLETKADNRPGTDTEPPGVHSSVRPNNTLDNGAPRPLDPHWAFPRGHYPAMVIGDYPDNIEFDIYYEATDERVPILLPYGRITVAMVKQALYKRFYPEGPDIDAKYLHQIRIYYNGYVTYDINDWRAKALQDDKCLSYQDLHPYEGSGGVYIARLFTPTGEVWGAGEGVPINGDKPGISKSMDPDLNKYKDERGRQEGVDVQYPDVTYIGTGFMAHRRTRTDLLPWDIARIPGGPEWATTLQEEVRKVADGDDYLRTLTVSSADGYIRYNWASNRRGGPTLDSTPTYEEFPLRLSRAAKYARRS